MIVMVILLYSLSSVTQNIKSFFFNNFRLLNRILQIYIYIYIYKWKLEISNTLFQTHIFSFVKPIILFHQEYKSHNIYFYLNKYNKIKNL